MTQWEENNKEVDRLRIEKQTNNFGLYAIRFLNKEMVEDAVPGEEKRKIYIGRAKNVIKRWGNERSRAFNENDTAYNTALSCFIRVCGNSYKEVKSKIEFVLIAEFDTLKEVLNAEVEYILKFKTNINRFGKLYGYNLTDGGEGNNGYVHSPEQKLKQSIAMKKHNAENPRSPEYCENISIAKTGIIFSDEHKKNLSIALKNRPIEEKASNATIDFNTAQLLRVEFLTGKHSTEMLSKKYNINTSNIRNILYNKVWIDINYIPNVNIIKEILHSNNSQNKLNREVVNKLRIDFQSGNFSFAD